MTRAARSPWLRAPRGPGWCWVGAREDVVREDVVHEDDLVEEDVARPEPGSSVPGGTRGPHERMT